MSRLIATICAVSLAITAVAQSLPPELNGKSGASLRAAAGLLARPDRTADPRSQWVDMAGNPAGPTFYDIFSGQTTGISAITVFPGIIPTDYWSLSPICESAAADLYNHIPFTAEAISARADAIPGTVETTTFDNGIWRAGRGTISGLAVELYEPPAEYRGDFARIIFYMATVYPTNSLTSRGYMMMDGTDYPCLTRYARNILLSYHRADPVSATEMKRAAAIEAVQGNINPFVIYPDLAEYLWGDRQGEEVVIPGEPLPLRGTYAITDERIDLISPYVPTDARWSIDGRAVNASTPLSPADLGIGLHQLNYHSPSTGARGILTIRIIQTP